MSKGMCVMCLCWSFQFDVTVTLHLPQPHCTTLCSLHHCQQVQFGNHNETKHKPGFLE